jgi:hypothetical protein
VIARYSGNPLALQIVAETVKDVFGGGLASFMCEEALIFDDIRDVLDQQWSRLTALEFEQIISEFEAGRRVRLWDMANVRRYTPYSIPIG